MNANHSTRDTKSIMEESRMELTRSQELVKQLKEIKENNEITFPRIIDLMEANGRVVSLSTLRRVFANGSDPNSFSYENTLLPIADVLLHVEDNTVNLDPVTAKYEKEIDGLKAVIACQNEELSQLYQTKDFLQERIRFMQEQINIKDRRIDEKEETIRTLINKIL